MNRKSLIHISFEIGLLLKGIDGIVEIIGGFLLLIISPNQIHTLINKISQHELSEDPNDILIRFIIKLSNDYSVSTQVFSAIYLFSHGIIKLLIIYLLNKKKYWAYPLSIAFLVLFIFYQSYRYINTRSIWLNVLSIFDIMMIYLTYSEYKNIHKKKLRN
jgi:Predicted membrane protein